MRATAPSAKTALAASRCLAAAVCAWALGVAAHAQPPGAAETDAGETYPIPADATTFEQLMEFIDQIDRDDPTEETEQETIARQRKIARTVVGVTERMLSLELKPRQAMEAAYFSLTALNILGELDEPGADEAFANAIEELLADSRRPVRAVAMKFFVETGLFVKWDDWTQNERTAFIDRIIAHLKQTEVDGSDLQTILTVVDYLGDIDGDQFAKQLLDELVPHFKNSSNETVQSMIETLEGIGRRLNLLGNKMKLIGTLLDGTELDWESYRGKVVLVDFWAIGCKPCRAELPNVLREYKAYHDKGFEVLGINLDSKREPVEQFLQKAEIPWDNLFVEHTPEKGPWHHPMADYYGVTGIPRAILVDRDGTVVNMNARGKVLPRELRRLLGEPLAQQPLIQGVFLQPAAITADDPR